MGRALFPGFATQAGHPYSIHNDILSAIQILSNVENLEC